MNINLKNAFIANAWDALHRDAADVKSDKI